MSTRVTLIGLGNIGSHFADLLAREPRVDSLTAVDFDRYSRENLLTQAIAPGDAGLAKPLVVARRLRRIRPSLRITPIFERVENVPLGLLDAGIIVACVDSLAARLTISEAAWRLGVPFIDTGVQALGSFARVTVQVPGREYPCLQCAWDERDYARIEQRYACQGEAASFPTNAPAWLGAIAASFGMAEVVRLIEGDTSSAGHTLLIDAQTQQVTNTRTLRRAECRFDHATWFTQPLGARAADLTLGSLFEHFGADASLRVWNRPWIRQHACPACRREEAGLTIATAEPRKCACGGALLPVGFMTSDALSAAEVPAAFLDRALAGVGLRDGDVMAVTHGEDAHYFTVGATR